MSYNLPPGCLVSDLDPEPRCSECGSRVARHVREMPGGVLHYCMECWDDRWARPQNPEGLPICPCCGNPHDPEVCWCGEVKKFHTREHSFVPMGCDCGRATERPQLNEDDPREER